MASTARSGAGNDGVKITADGPVTITGSAIGHGARVSTSAPPSENRPGSPRDRWDIGVITVLSEETQAVADMLYGAGHCQRMDRPNGLRFEEAILGSTQVPIRMVATQTLDRGPLSAGLAFGELMHYYNPAVVALVGIAGGIHPDVHLGDVVIAQEVIYYDHRKETPARVRRRGSSRQVPAPVRHAINRFFSDHGEPCPLTVTGPDGAPRTFGVLPGPIGSGDAVVADGDSDIRAYLRAYNDKTLALETEAGGLAQAFYERAASNASAGGWLAIRGISDYANTAKNDTWHRIASAHAAAVLELLAPYLSRL